MTATDPNGAGEKKRMKCINTLDSMDLYWLAKVVMADGARLYCM